ncbi:thionin BTH7-like [Brachypodium distachyon]|uniref:Uncharacterized protein n=1 Tax=Brachypodium distachyon TaxID=15368 RepID=I1H3Q0_BRADI|nr:thionin BTH7-like [Brachypodium distachyon]KQK20892.1 hypothetical protein BRADI_1g57337v3 [Brachypodium distachyon]|eukprot:XP_024313040.1 thionin BTH7-like [Brachypodium distachyon]
MGSNNGLRSVIICVLILGLVLEQVQVDGKSCCKTTMARNCYNVCRFGGGARPVCARSCGCKIIKGSTCPNGFPTMHLPDSPMAGEPDAIKYCNIGCSSTVCDKMDHVFRSEEMKINVELCLDACVSFCNGDAAVESVAA